MKEMPTADELRNLCTVDMFVKSAETTARHLARRGEIFHLVEVPAALNVNEVHKQLLEAFPGCKITKKSWSRHIEISWV